MKNPTVAVVVLNYKGINDTIACIASLANQTFTNFTIVAVENGSNDGSAAAFKDLEITYGSRLKTLYNAKNLGFDGGVNTGITWALEHDFNYIALLNNDAVADDHWLEQLFNTAQTQQSGMTTSLLLHESGDTIDSTGDWYSKWGLPFPRNRGHSSINAPNSEEVFGATGGATLYSADMLRDIGIFDNDFFAYYEDVDISFRAQLRGWKVYYEKSAIAYHKQGATSSRMKSGFTVYQTFKNLPLVFIKNVPFGLLIPVGIRFYTAYWLMAGKAILRGQGIAAIKGVFMAFVLGIKKLPERWHIQKRKKVSSSHIRNLLWNDLPPDQTGLRKFRSFFMRTK